MSVPVPPVALAVALPLLSVQPGDVVVIVGVAIAGGAVMLTVLIALQLLASDTVTL